MLSQNLFLFRPLYFVHIPVCLGEKLLNLVGSKIGVRCGGSIPAADRNIVFLSGETVVIVQILLDAVQKCIRFLFRIVAGQQIEFISAESRADIPLLDSVFQSLSQNLEGEIAFAMSKSIIDEL